MNKYIFLPQKVRNTTKADFFPVNKIDKKH